jgi:hypothetical protein
MRTLPLTASAYWAQVRATVGLAEQEDPAELGAVMSRYACRLEQSLGDRGLQFGAWHGDWVPWNLARQGRQLFAWDWEYSGHEAPLGFDLLHYQFQTAFVFEGRTVAEAAERCLGGGVSLLRRLGLPEDLAANVAGLYLLEVLLRDYRMKRLAGSWSPGMYPDLLRVLAVRC